MEKYEEYFEQFLKWVDGSKEIKGFIRYLIIYDQVIIVLQNDQKETLLLSSFSDTCKTGDILIKDFHVDGVEKKLLIFTKQEIFKFDFKHILEMIIEKSQVEEKR